jgi:GDSL-like Lipase/Acylhydrolase family
MPARPPRAPARRALLALGAAALVGACGASEAASPPPDSGTVGGVGSLPDPLTVDDTATSAPATTDAAPSTIAEKTAPADVIGDVVDGNRVLLIGDSLLASTSRRYGGQMCAALVPMGWAVEVDAETGRFIDFGDRVLDARLRPERGVDWDAAVVFLGNNYNGDEVTFRRLLDDVVRRLAPRPVVLPTVTEFRADRAEVNDVIRSLAATYPNVRVIDWNAVTDADVSLLGDDGLHLTDAGRSRLAYEVAAVLGAAPADEPPACLSTSFSNDSAGAPPSGPRTAGGTSGGTGSTTTLPRSGASTTTVAAGQATTTTLTLPAPTTTVAPTLAPTTTAAGPPKGPPTTTVVITPPASADAPEATSPGG